MNELFELDITIMNPTFIFVDGSYYNFYRYYALTNWWKNAFPEEPLEDPYQNEKFVEKFKKIHVETLQQIPKKLKLDKKFRKTFIEHVQKISKKLGINKLDVEPILIVGKDCKRENIWRNELFPQYKATRTNDGFKGGPFFKMAYEEDLFGKGGAKAILKHPKLEADDCIAISVKHVIKRYPDCTIYIITSDRDYLQLNAPNVDLYNLSFKNIADKSSIGDPKSDLEIKIIMGDSSDNIPSVFPKCGPKTALKCFGLGTF